MRSHYDSVSMDLPNKKYITINKPFDKQSHFQKALQKFIFVIVTSLFSRRQPNFNLKLEIDLYSMLSAASVFCRCRNVSCLIKSCFLTVGGSTFRMPYLFLSHFSFSTVANLARLNLVATHLKLSSLIQPHTSSVIFPSVVCG